MESSVFKKSHRDILIEYKYNTDNYISDNFKILINNKDSEISYIGSNLTLNNINNQLFPIDIVKNKWSKIDSSYNFLSLSDHYSIGPVQNDIFRLYFPSNYNFNEYLGIFIKIYTFDYTNKKLVNLSNFFYDRNDVSQNGTIDSILPPLLYENRLWSSVIELQIPSVNFVSNQRINGLPVSDTINDKLTNGVGLSLSSPIFVDFSFITGYDIIGNQKKYFLNNPFSLQFPRSPELEELKLYAQESKVGDYFEIYPIYKDSFTEFSNFIEQSKSIGKVYYVEYFITIFEENIKGKTIKFTTENDFSNMIEWRPIIKYSTTTANIDIEMRLIDKVDGSIITRKALYGLKPNQISKYSLNIKRIKIGDIKKPKIYVKKNIELANIDSLTRNNQYDVTINVDVPTLINMNNICAYSPNNISPKSESTLNNYYVMGDMKILIEPFDNIIEFNLAFKKDNNIDFLDLTNSQNIKLLFKSSKSSYEFPIISNRSNLKNGSCSFKIPQRYYNDLKKAYLEKSNLFYIVTVNNDITTLIYSALYLPSDTNDATTLFNNISSVNNNVNNSGDIILQEEGKIETAIITRKLVKVSDPVEKGATYSNK